MLRLTQYLRFEHTNTAAHEHTAAWLEQRAAHKVMAMGDIWYHTHRRNRYVEYMARVTYQSLCYACESFVRCSYSMVNPLSITIFGPVFRRVASCHPTKKKENGSEF